MLYEAGKRQAGPGNALHDEIRREGGGPYLFWHGFAYFVPSNNSDPRRNGRVYEIRFARIVPVVLANTLYAATLIVVIAAQGVAVRRLGWSGATRGA